MRRPYSITTNRLRSNRATPQDARPGPPVDRRVSLVALEEEIQIPAHRGLVGRRRLRVLRIEQAALPLDSFVATRPPLPAPKPPSNQIEAATRRGLPSRQPEPADLECRLEGRAVRLRSIGEMMADEAGNFYEVCGGQLRPLGELVSDEQGRIFEVRATSESAAAESAKQQEEANGSPDDRARAEVASKTEALNQAKTPSRRPAPARTAPEETSPGYRKILADPGLYLKLPWSNIKGEIRTQVEHPERLSDTDEVECYAQIYEARWTLSAAQLAAAEMGDGAMQAHLHPLTRDKARMLGTPQLFRPASHPFETRASTRQIHAGQRVYRLWPLFDPTAERLAEPGRESATSKNDVALRIEVPREYLNPAQFRHPREEVLYDMKGALGTLPPQARTLARCFLIYPLRVVKALVTATVSRRRMKKWRAMLAGKEPDKQLWAVTPPRGFSYNTTVRSWAEHTLGEAGYDAQPMLLEWEIFWRRRGWS